ncbi:MAG TPA: hypothetical protein ENJ95_08905 [Bacteroidetes bacterium]|nr:hypothetical protein [Bacteroidota bacterium]
MKKPIPTTIHLKAVRYPGRFIPTKVWLNNKSLWPAKSKKLRNLSAHGFGWGSDETGAAQLALAICIELYPRVVALEIYDSFKKEFILPIREDGFIMEIDLKEFQESWAGTL